MGYEKIRNWAFQHDDDQKGFVDYLLANQPEPPKYFAMMKKLNKVERPLLTQVPTQTKLSGDAVKAAMEKGIKLIDTRNKVDFAKGFIPGSINIQGNNAFATWMGWFVNYEEPFMLVANDGQIEDLTRKLMRIGLDNVLGYIDDVNALEIPLQKSEIIEIDEFKSYLDREDTQVIDLRGVSEYTSKESIIFLSERFSPIWIKLVEISKWSSIVRAETGPPLGIHFWSKTDSKT